jgi:hypothetical protein
MVPRILCPLVPFDRRRGPSHPHHQPQVTHVVRSAPGVAASAPPRDARSAGELARPRAYRSKGNFPPIRGWVKLPLPSIEPEALVAAVTTGACVTPGLSAASEAPCRDRRWLTNGQPPSPGPLPPEPRPAAPRAPARFPGARFTGPLPPGPLPLSPRRASPEPAGRFPGRASPGALPSASAGPACTPPGPRARCPQARLPP